MLRTLKCFNYSISSNNINWRGIKYLFWSNQENNKKNSQIRCTDKNELLWTVYQSIKNVEVKGLRKQFSKNCQIFLCGWALESSALDSCAVLIAVK
jgi:hypothetical protein